MVAHHKVTHVIDTSRRDASMTSFLTLYSLNGCLFTHAHTILKIPKMFIIVLQGYIMQYISA